MRKITIFLAASFIALLALSGCGAGNPTETPIPAATATSGAVEGLATVEGVDIQILESMPVQVQAVIKGYLPDPCTRISSVGQSRDGNTFKITISTARPADAVCAEVITPFEHTVSLDVTGLKAGTYTVTVHGISATFELTADNIAP